MKVVLDQPEDAVLLKEATDLVRKLMPIGSLPNLQVRAILVAAIKVATDGEARQKKLVHRLRREFTRRSLKVRSERAPRKPRAKLLSVPDAALAAITGPEPRTQGEMIARTWQYVRDHGLHRDKKVYPDALLRVLFRRPITPFQLAAKVYEHLSAQKPAP